MKKITTRTGLVGAAGLGAAALVIGGIAAPAMADSVDYSTSSNDFSNASSIDPALQNTLDFLNGTSSIGNGVLLSPTTGTDVGGVVNGPLVEGPLVSDSLNGDVLSGNDTPVGSGNDVPVGSGNDVNAPVGSGNDVAAPVDVTAPVDAPVGSGNDTSVDTGDAGIGSDVTGGDVTGDIGADVSDLVDGITTDVTSGLGLGDILN